MKPRRNHLPFLFFLTAFAALAFTGGVAGMRYGWSVAAAIDGALSAGDALREKQNTISGALPSVDEAMQRSIVTGDATKSYAGYTLITLRYARTAYLLGMDGKPAHRWHMPFGKAFRVAPHVAAPVSEDRVYMMKAEAFPDGRLLAVYHGNGDTPYGYGMAMMDKDSNLLWSRPTHMHHDFYVDKENGIIYSLEQNFVRTPPPGLQSLTYPVLADDIVTLSAGGAETGRISILEAFQGTPWELFLYQPPKIAPWDTLHTNSIIKLEPDIAAAFPMFQPGQLLISLRNLDAIAVIDPDTRKVVWAASGVWKAQHQASFLANGHILLLDNQGHFLHGKNHSRVIEFDPATLGVTWSYTGGGKNAFYTDAYGRAERLPNGNTLIADAANARVIEVTEAGEIAWSYRMPRIYADHVAVQSDAKDAGGIDPNLANLVTSASRYAEESLPFLNQSGIKSGNNMEPPDEAKP